MLADYLPAFTTASKPSPRTLYLDLFAGEQEAPTESRQGCRSRFPGTDGFAGSVRQRRPHARGVLATDDPGTARHGPHRSASAFAEVLAGIFTASIYG
jgi:hypothetical protein